jgi:hypothetical protein
MKRIFAKMLRFHRGMNSKNVQFGGAALEYIMVTTFAAIIGIAALGYTGKAIKEQLKRLGEQMGITEEPEINLPFTNSTN